MSVIDYTIKAQKPERMDSLQLLKFLAIRSY